MSAPIATVFPASSALPLSAVFPANAVSPVSTVMLPLATDLPPDVDVDEVLVDVSDDSVSAPAGQVDELVEVVDRAGGHSIELSIVVLDEDPGRDSQLRDLATEVGAEEGGTVLVLSPSWVGTYSDSLSRVELETGQDRTYTGDPVVSSNNFVDELVEPGVPWAAITATLIVLVVVAAVVSLVAKLRRSRAPGADEDRQGDGASHTASPNSQ